MFTMLLSLLLSSFALCVSGYDSDYCMYICQCLCDGLSVWWLSSVQVYLYAEPFLF